MWVTAITGDIAAGKSSVSTLFREMGAVVIDADEIAKSFWSDGEIITAAVARWGDKILHGGKINFKAIAEIIFSSREENRFACELLHPKVRAKMGELVRAQNSGAWVVAEVPLLFESGVPEWVNRTIFVTAPFEQRLARARERGWSEAELLRRESFFIPSDKRIKKSDFLIKNEGTLEELRKKLTKLARNFKERSRNTIETCLSGKFIDLLRIAGAHAEDMGKRVYLVGGAVRDILLGRPTNDVDVVVEGNAISLLHRMYKNECRAKDWEMNFYKKYGSGTLVNKISGLRIDFVSTRSERFEETGKRPTMFQANINQDLYRRDFTVNAIAMSITKKSWGTLLDPLGGARDISARLLRVLHDKSFLDDPTRILRGIRFEQRLGFQFEPHTMKLLREAVRENVFGGAVKSRLEKEWNVCMAENEVGIKNRLFELGVPQPIQGG